MSSNLPPGVTESMIPGNRPEDIEEEAFWDKLYELLTEAKVSTEVIDRLYTEPDESFSRAIIIARDMGYDAGREDEKTDALFEQQALDVPLD